MLIMSIAKSFLERGYSLMINEFEKYREMERLFQEASNLPYDDNTIKFMK